MQIIIITDIFGLTKDIELLAASLPIALASVTVIDPYDGHKQTFINEQAAYDTFMIHIAQMYLFKLLIYNEL